MTFEPAKLDEFLSVFEIYQSHIRSVNGCFDLKLIQHSEIENQISTLSKWDSEDSLNAYRDSALFKEVWPLTKLLFSERPEAKSFKIITEL
jgi:heme-degrading monooxygenase HmoA